MDNSIKRISCQCMSTTHTVSPLLRLLLILSPPLEAFCSREKRRRNKCHQMSTLRLIQTTKCLHNMSTMVKYLHGWRRLNVSHSHRIMLHTHFVASLQFYCQFWSCNRQLKSESITWTLSYDSPCEMGFQLLQFFKSNPCLEKCVCLQLDRVVSVRSLLLLLLIVVTSQQVLDNSNRNNYHDAHLHSVSLMTPN